MQEKQAANISCSVSPPHKRRSIRGEIRPHLNDQIPSMLLFEKVPGQDAIL